MNNEDIRDISAVEKKDNREVIISHLVGEHGAVVLNEEQERMLERWQFVDDQIRSNKFTVREIQQLVIKKYDVSLATARRDIRDTRYVFGTGASANKKYLLAVHAERIEFAMQLCLQERDWRGYAALCREYTAAIDKMPDDNVGKAADVTANFLIQPTQINVLINGGMTEEQAIEVTKKFMPLNPIEISEG